MKVARSNFHGRITYGAASDLEQVDWSIFDIVGLDYYSYHARHADHAKERDVPVIPPQYVRNEQEQADHLTDMLQVFSEHGFLGASPYTFISPDAPHRPRDRPHDEDMAAFSLCKVLRYDNANPASPYRWLPKKSFDAVARFYA